MLDNKIDCRATPFSKDKKLDMGSVIHVIGAMESHHNTYRNEYLVLDVIFNRIFQEIFELQYIYAHRQYKKVKNE